ncbi:hypothetical protein C173_26071, partial [Paenibacillus sp. FSL R7-277]
SRNDIIQSKYWISELEVHRKDVGFKDALNNSDLPEKWLQLDKALVNIAIEESQDIQRGKYSVFFPTQDLTGMPFWVNGIFYSDISRKNIDFTMPWNRYLLQRAAELLVFTVDQLSESEEVPLSCLLDLISFPPDDLLFQHVKKVLEDKGRSIMDWVIFPDLNGTRNQYMLSQILFVDETERIRVVVPDRIAALGHSILRSPDQSRLQSIERLVKRLRISIKPSAENWAHWVEELATKLLAAESDIEVWKDFYADLTYIQNEYVAETNKKQWLSGRKVFLSNDSQLVAYHAANSLFVPPRNAGQNPLPEYIRDRVAFILSNLYPADEQEKHILRDVTTRFELSVLLERVVLPAYQVKELTSDDELYDMLAWLIPLIRNGNETRDIGRFGDILLPCQGGWFKAKETLASVEWRSHFDHAEAMEILCEHSREKGNKNGSSRKLLRKFSQLPDRIQQLGYDQVASFFRLAGAKDTFRLTPYRTKVFGHGNNLIVYDLKEIPSDYRSYVNQWARECENPYSGNNYSYDVTFSLITESDLLHDIPVNMVQHLSDIMIASFKSWNQQNLSWSLGRISKLRPSFNNAIRSPLMIVIRELKWVPTMYRNNLEFRRPSETIYLPDAVNRHAPFAIVEKKFLQKLLPYAIDLTHSSELLNAMVPSARSGAALLNYLAKHYSAEYDRYFKPFYSQVWELYLEHDDFIDHKVQNIVVARDAKQVKSSAQEKIYLFTSDEKSMRDQLLSSSAVRVLHADLNKSEIVKLCGIYGWLSGKNVNRTITPHLTSPPSESEMFESGSRVGMTLFLLSIACYARGNQMKPGSATFKQAKQILERTTIQYVMRIQVVYSDQTGNQLDSQQVDWAIDHEKNIWYITEQASLTNKFAEGIAELLDNSNLIYQIKAALPNGLGNSKEEREAILIRTMGIDWERIRAVELHMNDEISLMRDNLFPCLLAFGKGALDLTEYDTLEKIKQFLYDLFDSDRQVAISFLEAAKLVSARDRGRYLYDHHAIPLHTWNTALMHPEVQGTPVVNLALKAKFHERKAHVKNRLLSLIRKRAYEKDDCAWYASTLDSFASWNIPESWCLENWELHEDRFEAAALDWLNEQGICVVELPTDNTEAPDDIARLNHKRWNTIALSAIHIGRLLEKRNEMNFNINSSEQLLFVVFPQADLRFQWKLYSETELLQRLFVVFPNQDKSVTSLEEWITLYGVTKDELDSEQERYKEQKMRDREEKARANRMMEISGKTVEVTEETMYELWSMLLPLKVNISFEGSPIAPLVLDEQASFLDKPGQSGGAITGGSNGGGSGGRRGGIVDDRISPELDKLIGLAGELWMYQWVVQNLPESGPHSWLSGNKRYHFKSDHGLNDHAGYDFLLYINGKEIQVEVKATRGTRETFKLGASQTYAAREVLRRQREGESVQYVIAFITEAVSNPKIEFLPNPYSSEGASFYTFPKGEEVQLMFSLKNKRETLTPKLE